MAKRKSIKEGVQQLIASINLGATSAKISKAARSLSSDPVYNLTCFLMVDFGPVMTGMEEKDWKEEAKRILKIVAKN